mmetsp:Transcript_42246/g.106428  ORF Transcript_42246/g.106428 Transcript_42246/m.106428 type:complete len:235 (-) Transcript_42246:1835-2539(-)
MRALESLLCHLLDLRVVPPHFRGLAIAMLSDGLQVHPGVLSASTEHLRALHNHGAEPARVHADEFAGHQGGEPAAVLPADPQRDLANPSALLHLFAQSVVLSVQVLHETRDDHVERLASLPTGEELLARAQVLLLHAKVAHLEDGLLVVLHEVEKKRVGCKARRVNLPMQLEAQGLGQDLENLNVLFVNPPLRHEVVRPQKCVDAIRKLERDSIVCDVPSNVLPGLRPFHVDAA